MEKISDPPLAEKEGVEHIFSEEFEKQRENKKLTNEAKQELNMFKAQLAKKQDFPDSVRDSEALRVAISKARENMDI
jgi:hypothetical protein